MSAVPTRARSAQWLGRRQLPSATAAVLLIGLIAVVATRGSSLFSNSGLAGALPELAPLVLATLGVSAVALAGPSSVDLSVGPLLVFVNVVIVQWFVPAGFDSPVVLILLVVLVGVAFEVTLGFLIGRLRIQPVIVTLAGYLVLSGLALVILPQPGGAVPLWLASWGSPSSALSPPLYVLVVALIGWAALSRTTLMRNIRLAGANERTAYVSGLPLVWARVAAHTIAGIFIGLSGLMLAALLQSGDPTQGSTYTLEVIAALVLGGASLSGGRAGAVGAVLGSLDVYLIGYLLGTYNFGAKSSYVVQFSTGIVLVAALTGTTLVAAIAQARKRRAGALEAA